MIIPIIMAITGLLLISNPNAEPMTHDQKVMQGVYLTAHAIDWGQTRYIATHPDEHGEQNPILGRHPSTDEVGTYFLSTALLHTGITKSLPSKYRKYWQIFTIGVEVGTVNQNMRLGIGMEF